MMTEYTHTHTHTCTESEDLIGEILSQLSRRRKQKREDEKKKIGRIGKKKIEKR